MINLATKKWIWENTYSTDETIEMGNNWGIDGVNLSTHLAITEMPSLVSHWPVNMDLPIRTSGPRCPGLYMNCQKLPGISLNDYKLYDLPLTLSYL